MRGRRTRVAVRSTRHSSFDPDRWWETRDGTRTEIIELRKLLLDVIRYLLLWGTPLSKPLFWKGPRPASRGGS
jgi:hypothetical protein